MSIPQTAASKREERAQSPYLALVLAWIFPGLGHLYLGRRGRAVVLCLLVLAALAIGCLLSGNLYRAVERSPLTALAALACMGMGAPYFILRFGFDYLGDVLAPGYEYGSAFILTAGLMNLLLVLDAWDIGSGSKE